MTGPSGFRLEIEAGLTIVRSVALLEIPGVGHAFSTRRGPDAADFDLGFDAGGRPPAAARVARLCAAAGLAAESPVLLRQVHGAEILDAASVDPQGAHPEADALIARHEDGLVVGVRTADCVPLILAEAHGRVVAAVHAGWRGVAGRIVPQAVLALGRAGHQPSSLRAILGPAIGGCCYQVGREVLDEVARGVEIDGQQMVCGAAERPRLDLRAAVRRQLERAGVPPWAIEVAPWCTSCSRTLFYSHRREGGGAGRHLAVIGWIGGVGGAKRTAP